MKRKVLFSIAMVVAMSGGVEASGEGYDDEVISEEYSYDDVVSEQDDNSYDDQGYVAIENIYKNKSMRSKYNWEVLGFFGSESSDDDSALLNSTFLGVGVERYMTDNFSFSFTYESTLDLQWKIKKGSRGERSLIYDECGKVIGNSECNSYCSEYELSCGDSNDNTSSSGGNDTTGDASNNNSEDASNGASEDASNNANANDANNGSNENKAPSKPENKLENNKLTGTGVLSNMYQIKDVRADRFFINAAYYINDLEVLEHQYKFVPYFITGIGYEILDSDIKGEENQVLLKAGLGAKYKLSSMINGIFEGDVIRKNTTSDTEIRALIGLSVKFDKRENGRHRVHVLRRGYEN
jgi:hypothetical protein